MSKLLISLKEKLLKYGGEKFQVEWFIEDNICSETIENLLNFGILRSRKTQDFKLFEMSTSRCHENSIILSLNNKNLSLVTETGFALSDDKIWRVHSWVYDVKNNLIIETTEERVFYYGICSDLDPKMCDMKKKIAKILKKK